MVLSVDWALHCIASQIIVPFRVSPYERKPRESWGPVFCLKGECSGLDEAITCKPGSHRNAEAIRGDGWHEESIGKRKLKDDRFSHPFSSDLKKVIRVVTGR